MPHELSAARSAWHDVGMSEEAKEPEPVSMGEAWGEEIRRRLDRALAGESVGKPWSEVREAVRARLTRRKSA